MITLPSWSVALATMLGNALWVYGLWSLVTTISIAWLSLEDQRQTLNITLQAVKDNKQLQHSHQWMSNVLVWTGGTISVVGIGSGFWFVGSVGLLSVVVLSNYRQLFWQYMANPDIKISDTVD